MDIERKREKLLVFGIPKRIGLIGKWKLDAFIVRLQSVLQKNDQFGILSLSSSWKNTFPPPDDNISTKAHRFLPQ